MKKIVKRMLIVAIVVMSSAQSNSKNEIGTAYPEVCLDNHDTPMSLTHFRTFQDRK